MLFSFLFILLLFPLWILIIFFERKVKWKEQNRQKLWKWKKCVIKNAKVENEWANKMNNGTQSNSNMK